MNTVRYYYENTGYHDISVATHDNHDVLSDSTTTAIAINSDQIVTIATVSWELYVTCLIKASFSLALTACRRA